MYVFMQYTHVQCSVHTTRKMSKFLNCVYDRYAPITLYGLSILKCVLICVILRTCHIHIKPYTRISFHNTLLRFFAY